MSGVWQGDERRSHPRKQMGGDVRGEMDPAVETPLMDLSLSGALLEVSSALPKGERYDLKLPSEDSEGGIAVTAEVVRSYVHGFDKEGAGPPSVRYRAAVKFVEMTDAQTAVIQEILSRGDETIQVELST